VSPPDGLRFRAVDDDLTLGAEVAEAIALAAAEARAQGAGAVAPEHLLCALVIVAAEEVSRLLETPLDVAAVTDRSHGHAGADAPEDGPLPLAHGTLAVLEAALAEAASAGGEVAVAHVLLGLLDAAPDACARVLFDTAGAGRTVRRNAAVVRVRWLD
jgi:ATP-dependent Clp protease ATP-binding subunit ClpA